MIAAAVLWSCGSSAPPTGSGNLACETEDPPMTSGGDWGPPFEFDDGADSTGEGAGYEPPEEWADDPTQWELHTASGTYYRAPTLDELT